LSVELAFVEREPTAVIERLRGANPSVRQSSSNRRRDEIERLLLVP
jgi:hypothetical protein